MTLAGARSTLVRLRFARPPRTSRGEFAEREIVLFELRDAHGVRGFGEAAPWPGFVTETAAEALAVLVAAEPLLNGRDLHGAASTPALEELLQRSPTARAALQGALSDLAARRAGEPIAALLAAAAGLDRGRVLGSVPTSTLLLSREPGALREEAARARASGHRAVKIKLGAGSLEDDIARARAARDGIGTDVRLRGDANGAWTRCQARAALDALAEFGFDYVEQPVAADDLDGFVELHRGAAMRLAADESVSCESHALRLICAAAVDVVVLKPAILGGAERALGIALRARQAGIEVVFSHAFESAVGARHALHCAAAWGDPATSHGLCTAGLFEIDVAEPVRCAEGVATLTATPGLGITP